MNKPLLLALLLLVLAGVGVAVYLQQSAPPAPAGLPPAPADFAPDIRYPVPEAAPAPMAEPSEAPAATPTLPLPSLDRSDGPLLLALAEVAGAGPVERYLVPQSLVRHLVVTVDNLPRKGVKPELRPVVPVPGSLLTVGEDEQLRLSADNYARYAPLVRAVESVSAERLAAVYLRYYELFQQAYEELGYPDGYFNDRLVEVIDDLLATPEPAAPLHLVQPHVFYEYADPGLEERSAGQKLLLRMGPEHTRVIKRQLTALRAAVTGEIGGR